MTTLPGDGLQSACRLSLPISDRSTARHPVFSGQGWRCRFWPAHRSLTRTTGNRTNHDQRQHWRTSVVFIGQHTSIYQQLRAKKKLFICVPPKVAGGYPVGYLSARHQDTSLRSVGNALVVSWSSLDPQFTATSVPFFNTILNKGTTCGYFKKSNHFSMV
jgi:hypothetical protein